MTLSVKNQSSWDYDHSCSRFIRVKNGKREYYSIVDYLGNGATSNVYSLVPENEKKKIKAVKIAKEQSCKEALHVFFDREYETLRELPASMGVQLPPKGYLNRSMIVMPKYDGTIEKLYSKMTPEMILDAMNQLLVGIEALHDKGIIIVDVKGENILYRKKKDAIRYDLADFGCRTDSKDCHFKSMMITNLALVFQQMVFSGNSFGTMTVTEDHMKKRGLPLSLAKFINNMFNCDSDIKTVRRRFNECIPSGKFHGIVK